jgi:hypothetical protein
MANAKAAPLTFLPEPYGEERPMTNVETEEALQKLLEALEARRNRGYDPRMLALAEGFLGPTRTGSAFEGIGRAVGKFREADERERQEELEIAQQRLGLIGQMGEIERRKQRDKLFGRSLGLEPGPDVSQAAAAPGSEAYSPPGVGSMPGIQLMPPNRNIQTGRQYLQSAYLEGKEDYSAALAKAQDIEKKRYEVRENGIVDLATGLFFPVPKGEPVRRQIKGFDGTFEIPTSIAYLLDFYDAIGDRENYDKLAKRAIGKEEKPAGAPGAAPTTAPTIAPISTPTGSRTIKSREDLEVEAAARKATAETEARGAAEQEVKRRNEIIDAGDKAGASIILANNFRAFANRPDADQIFGFAARPELKYQIVRLLTSGVGLPGASVGVPELLESVRAMELNKDQMTAFQTFAQLTTELSLRMSEAVKGSVSNYEQGLFQKAVVNVEDLPTTIKMKADMLDARARFDREVARKFEESGMKVSQFKKSPEYLNARERYHDRLTLIVEGKPREQARKQGLSADQIRAERARRSGQ